MKELLDKLSSYHLFNYLLPGTVFVAAAHRTSKQPSIRRGQRHRGAAACVSSQVMRLPGGSSRSATLSARTDGTNSTINTPRARTLRARDLINASVHEQLNLVFCVLNRPRQ